MFFSTLDLKAGYWQIPVRKQDQDKTGFLTRDGLYRFRRMPFGLVNAPGTFQRVMDCVLRGLTWQMCLVYLDDVIVYTKGGFSRHLVELATVLERLSQAGLSLNLKKCTFATNNIEYLGHHLSPEGIRPKKRLVKAIPAFKTLADAAETKRFVHLAGFYRRFVSQFGTIMAPLTKLLRKSVQWEWSQKQTRSVRGDQENTEYQTLTAISGLYEAFSLGHRRFYRWPRSMPYAGSWEWITANRVR